MSNAEQEFVEHLTYREPSVTEMNEHQAFEAVRFNDATVQSMLSAGRSLEEIIVVLSREKTILSNEIIRLDSIAPKRYAMPDGTIRVWHCPDELIPLRKL
jgi:hypothetical protein